MLKEFTTDVLVLAIKDDDYPDCYVSSLESVPVEFDNSNPCLGGLDMDNAEGQEAALCAGTVSDSDCRLTCDDGFIGSAARVACVDGTWEKQTCDLDEESASYTQYIIIPIGAVITLVVVFFVARKQDLAMAAVMGMMKDTVILFGSITLEIMVRSRCVRCLFFLWE